MSKLLKFQNPSGSFPSYLFDVTQYKAPEEYTDTIEPAVITAKLPEKFHGSQAAAARYAAGQRWGKENVAEPRDKFAQEYVLPTMGAVAFGIPGLVGVGGGFAVDATINALTNGNKNSFGDLFVNPEKHPILNTAVNFFNPGYYLGGLAVTKPIVQTVSPRTAIALGLEKEYLKNEIKALNRRIKNWNGNNVIAKNILAGKIGWAPKQAITLWHNSETPISKLETTFPAWDVTTHDAPLGHVWGTSTETRQGFIGARPYHNKTSKPIILEKPMIQLNEAIGNGKNAVRNEILKFADQSGADAINFSNIKDNTLQNQDVYAVFKDIDVVPKLAEAERLGIPKGERSNLQALEDPQYWGYRQWNDRYNAAIESGNMEEAQRLRDLHFKIKAPNAPQYNFYHGTFNKEHPFYIFEPQSNNELFFHFSPYKDTAEKFMGIAKTRNENGRLITAKLNIQHPTMVTDSGWWNWYRIPEANSRISKTLGMDGPTAGQYYSNLLLKEPSISEANGKMMDILGNDAFMYKNYTEDNGRISIAVPRASQIKLADSITKTDTGEIIPIIKRDNFHNPDIRYKQGGILKAQNEYKIKLKPAIKAE